MNGWRLIAPAAALLAACQGKCAENADSFLPAEGVRTEAPAEAKKPEPPKAEAKKPEAPKDAAPKAPEEHELQPAHGEDVVELGADDSADAALMHPVTMGQAKKRGGNAAEPVPDGGVFSTALTRDESALVDITCDAATLHEILAQFRRTTGANIISDNNTNLMKRVSATLNSVPWKDALEAILRAADFRLEPRGSVWYVKEEPPVTPLYTRTFVLKHAAAAEVTMLINSSIGGVLHDPESHKPILNAGKHTGKMLANVFEGANAVVVTATEKQLEDCEAIIAAIDRSVPQIYIEARFIEVSNEALHKLGMQWDQLESWGASAKNLNAGFSTETKKNKSSGRTGSRSAEGAFSQVETGASDISSLLNNSTEGSSQTYTDKQGDGNSWTKTFSSTAKAGRSSASSVASAFGRSFSGQLSADDFRLALSAFESMSDAKIFSNPKILVSNGKNARVDMTTKFPHVRVTVQRNNTGGESYVDMAMEMQAIPGEDKMLFAKEAFFSWGITLDVKPRISPDGLISVEIVPTISELDKDVTPSGFYEVESDAAGGKYPIIKMKRLTTDFTMKDGATAVIGGLSRTREEDVDSGIPYLRKIPYVGPKIFGWKSRGKVQKEIIVFVTLGIADPADLPADVGLPKNAVAGREYVEGRKQEPGDREGAYAALTTLDLTPIDARGEKKKGKVTITPAKPAAKKAEAEAEQEAAKESEAAEAAEAAKAPEVAQAEGGKE